MATTRPYWLVYKGVPHIIEATGAAEAVRHIVDQDITELRSARASEVSAWTREGKLIPVAGQKAESAKPADAPQDANLPGFPNEAGKHLIEWLLEYAPKGLSDKQVREIIDHATVIAVEQKMTLENFDAVRALCPVFEKAVVWVIDMQRIDNSEGSSVEVTTDDVRGELEEGAFPIDVVMAALSMPLPVE